MKRISLNKVMAKLAEDKTELNQHEVELSLFDDLKKLTEKATQMYNKAYDDTFNAVDRAVDISLRSQKALNDLYQQTKASKENLERKAYEIGLGADQVNSLIGGVDKELMKLDQRIDHLSDISRTLNSLN